MGSERECKIKTAGRHDVNIYDLNNALKLSKPRGTPQFFKTLKQQLKIKSFVGTSPNALLSQLWVALIAYLLLSYLKFKSRFGWSLYTLSSILPTNLFVKRSLWDWLNAPFKAAGPAPPRVIQYELAFA